MGAREKLALFNMISGYLPGALVLDAYAGSGALGIEALSRGANAVEFVEKSPRAAKVIRENLQELGIEAKVVTGDVIKFTTGSQFNVILADPPYDDFEVGGVQHLVPFLEKSGVLVLSHPGEAPEINGVSLKQSRKYAGATISIYVKG